MMNKGDKFVFINEFMSRRHGTCLCVGMGLVAYWFIDEHGHEDSFDPAWPGCEYSILAKGEGDE